VGFYFRSATEMVLFGVRGRLRSPGPYLAVGSEAYAAARVFYYSAKGAAKANVPGADAIVKELARRYNPRAQSEEKEKAA
jgi:hypothetical protein